MHLTPNDLWQEIVRELSVFGWHQTIRSIEITFISIVGVFAWGLLLQGKDYFLIRRKHGEKGPFIDVLKRKLSVLIKCGKMLSFPIGPAAGMTCWWLFIFYANDVNFGEKFEGIATAGWLASFGVFYAIFTGNIFLFVYSKLHEVDESAKVKDIERYVVKRYTRTSPVIYTLIMVLSFFILGALMSVKFPSIISGISVVGSVSYILSLVVFALTEIDDPSRGTFFLKSIIQDYESVDPKKFWNVYYKERFQNFLKIVKEHGDTICFEKGNDSLNILESLILKMKRVPKNGEKTTVAETEILSPIPPKKEE